MKKTFKNITYFTLFYFVLFIIDTLVKTNLDTFPYRYFSKSALLVSLTGFYVINQREDHKKKAMFIYIALFCFIVGDMLFIGSPKDWRFEIAAGLFGTGKLLYALRFSKKKAFQVAKLIPFLLFSFTYMCGVLIMVYINLGYHLWPAFMYLLATMIAAQFAYLRKNEVPSISFWFVLMGVILFLFSDTVGIFKVFYNPSFLYSKYSTMFFYGASQYFIIIGLLLENNIAILKKK